MHSILLLLIFLCLPFPAYRNSFHASWHFDDVINILDNPYVHMEELSWDSLQRAVKGLPGGWRPTAYLSFALNHYGSGIDVFSYHVVNYILLCLTGYFFFRFLLALLRSPRTREHLPVHAGSFAFSVAALWLVLPLHTQSVTYIVQRMNLLGSLFFLLSFLAYLRGRERTPGAARLSCFGLSLLFFLLALGSKQNTAVFPVVVLLYEWIFHRDSFSSVWKGFVQRNSGYRRTLVFLLPALFLLFLAGLIYLYIPVLQESYRGKDFTLSERLLTQPRVIFLFISLILLPLPNRLNLDYNFPVSKGLLNPSSTLFSIAGLFMILLVAISSAKKRPFFSFFLFWFLGNLVIESSFHGLAMVFEHRTLLPSMGLLAAAGYAVVEFREKRPSAIHRMLGWPLFLIVFVLLSIFTYQRNHVWKNELSLWADVVEKSPFKARPHSALGLAYQNEGEWKKAMEEYQIAALLDPFYGEARNNQGVLLRERGYEKEAQEIFKEVIRITPAYPAPYINLGDLMLAQGNIEKALRTLSKAVELAPHDASAWSNLGLAHMKSGDPGRAEGCFREALHRDPHMPEAWNNLGILLARERRYPEAREAFQEAIRRKRCYAEPYSHLGNLHAMQNRLEEAIGLFTKALECDPELWNAYINRGTVHYKEGRVESALEDYQHALPHRAEDLSFLLKWAGALADSGDCMKALDSYRWILLKDPENVQAHFGLGMCMVNLNQWSKEARRHLKAGEGSGLSSFQNAWIKKVLSNWGKDASSPDVP